MKAFGLLLCLALPLSCRGALPPGAPPTERTARRSVPTGSHWRLGHPAHPYPLQAEIEPATNAPGKFSCEVTGNNALLRIPLAKGEVLWGFGERFDGFDLRGRVVESWARDMAQGGPNSSYFAVPFFISSAGYGLFVNCTGKVRFDCGASKPDELVIEVPEAGLDVYYFAGTPREVLAEYTKLVGWPQPVPDWVFEPWISRNSYLSAYEIDRVIDKMETNGLRAGAVVLEAWAEGLQNFKFEEHRYPNPREWIERLHRRGYHVVCWETPSIWTSASTYSVAKSNGWLVLNADGSEYVTDWLENGRKIDFRKTEAHTWWTRLHEPLVAMGVDGFKTDGGERAPDPWFHNLEPYYYQRAVLEALPSNGVTFARSADPPCSGNSTFWGGDQISNWNELPRVVRAGLSAAMSGFPFWGHDIGGFVGTPTKKLYIRWLELGAFSPIMEWHGTTPREPWVYDDETVRIAKFYLDLRWMLQPYLRAAAKEAIEHGIPMWRPLAFEFPDDVKTWEIEDEFLFGDDLLVAPMLSEDDGRAVYLPRGDWLDVWTKRKLTGPTNLVYHSELAVIPVFARNGGALSLPPAVAPTKLELVGGTNVRVWRGQTYEKIFLRVRDGGEVTLDAPAGLEVLPSRTQRGERLAFYVMWSNEREVSTYPVTMSTTSGTLVLQLVKPPPWPQKLREDGYVDLGKESETSASFQSEHGGRARLWLGSGDGMTVWLNGEQVFDKQVYRSPECDEDFVDVDLKTGANTVRVKLTHGPAGIGANGFYLRVDSAFAGLDGVRADALAVPVYWSMQPTGAYVAVTNMFGGGLLEARVYEESGRIVLYGPDLAGHVLTNAIVLEPVATIGGDEFPIGHVLSSHAFRNGLELMQHLATTSVVVRLTFPNDGVMRYEVVDWGGLSISGTRVNVASDAGEHFYGFGEKFNGFDQAGRKVRMLNTDRFGDKGDNSYKVAPWFLSTRGYGFHLDSSTESSFDMRAQFPDRYVIDNPVTSACGLCVTNALKFNIVYGPRLTDVLTRYTGYSGRPPLPPPWVFAPWMSSDIWHNGGEVRYVVTKMRERGIPGSVLVFDSPWEVAYNDYTWNMTQWGAGTNNIEGQAWAGFASVSDMMTFLRTNGWKVVCWMTPFLNKSSNNENIPGANLGQSANYAEAAASNYFVRAPVGGPLTNLVVRWWKGAGSPVDFTNPYAVRWVQKQLSNLVAQSSGVIGGFKTDDGESGHPPEDNSDTYIPKDASYSDGRTGVEMRNAYPLEYHHAIWNVLGTNGVLFARSGFAGSQAYPGYWCGDNQPNFSVANGLPSVIIAGQSAAASGFSIWGHDIGGYADSNYESDPSNLFMRWTQFGALSPIMQMHRQVGSGRQYPWSYSAAALTNYQGFAKLHMALFPYIYTYALQASTNGLPILRPLVLFHQTDPNVCGIDHAYLFGNELLVAPVISLHATNRAVYMPPGAWYDFFTNQRYIGGTNVVWNNSNQMQMPLFVREGAIVPMISTNVQTLCDAAYVSNPSVTTMTSALEFMIYPTTNSSFTVYDGTRVQCLSSGSVVTTTLTSRGRPILMRFFGAQSFGVERDGVALPHIIDARQFASATLGWRYDATSDFLQVKLQHAGGTSQIKFSSDTTAGGRGYRVRTRP